MKRVYGRDESPVSLTPTSYHPTIASPSYEPYATTKNPKAAARRVLLINMTLLSATRWEVHTIVCLVLSLAMGLCSERTSGLGRKSRSRRRRSHAIARKGPRTGRSKCHPYVAVRSKEHDHAAVYTLPIRGPGPRRHREVPF